MIDEQEQVVLVDEQDVEVGVAPKLAAHMDPRLHRAFSVFVFDAEGRMLLQRRAEGKYHSAGLWSNTACGHPRPGEPTAQAAARRLDEEMGFLCPLEHRTTMLYRADVGAGLVEHELDHIFVGVFQGEPVPHPDEVSEWRWASIADLHADVAAAPERYTPWFRLALEKLFPE
ncbi:isopentenyl-diphosphate Delta-isomerase [Longimicrobium sp.]|uniref:isopentenyl-diphosphate Delta-isomerase n=1 Tax=Longimicrobium sp. TaxID=2029185 RepID=UPI003B3BB727